MKNKLQTIFRNNEPTLKGTLKFDDKEAYVNFLTEMQKAMLDEKKFIFSGVKELSFHLEDGVKKYSDKKIEMKEKSDVIITPYRSFSLDVDIDNGITNFIFESRILDDNKVNAKTTVGSIIQFETTFDPKKNKVDIKYKMKLQLASDIADIVNSLIDLKGLLLYLYTTEDNEMEEIIFSLETMIEYWTKVRKIEEVFNITFNTKKLNDSNDNKEHISRLYMLMIKKYPLKEKLNAFAFKISDAEIGTGLNLKKDQEFAFSMIEQEECTVYSKKISFYKVNYIYNSIVEQLEYDEINNLYNVTCRGTEIKPMFCLYKGYVSMDSVSKEKDFSKILKEYDEARSYLKKLKVMDK